MLPHVTGKLLEIEIYGTCIVQHYLFLLFYLELLTLPGHLSLSPVLVCLCYSIFSFMCNALLIVVCPSVLFLLAIVLSVLLQFMNSDYPVRWTLLGPPVDAKTKKWVNSSFNY